ncbi:ribonuclease PH [Gemmatimonadota bacterium]
MRGDGRGPGDLRPISVDLHTVSYAEGSCLISAGNTRVLCAASVQEGVPPWREASGKGWVTAEYGMLPRSTHTRTPRERTGARGRTQEIQRLIGRSLRSVTDMVALGQQTVVVDCDVLQADGGTRTAAITGAALALSSACRGQVEAGLLARNPIRELVAGVSVGLVDGNPCLDLDYSEDSRAQVDLNLVATESGHLVEVQGTAEGDPFSRPALDELLDLGMEGIRLLIRAQLQALSDT